MRLTDEQVAFRDHCVTGEHLVGEAGAGSGKTTIAKVSADAMLAARTVKRGVYIGFNKAVADEAAAKFPRQIDCRTGHSLAYREIIPKRNLGHKLPSKRAKLSMADTARALGLDATLLDGVDGGESHWLQADTLARIALTTVERYYRSDRDDLSKASLLRGFTPPGVDGDQFADVVLDAAAAIWSDHTAADGQLQMPHDAYRKMWALGRPQLRADVVILDEAQDTPPVLAKVIQDQRMQQIALGDSFQQLYKWAGARDALAKWDPAVTRLQLTQSFRFGPAIAAEANKWLTLGGSPMRLKGWDAIPSRLGELGDSADAVLCRTNVGAVGEVMNGIAGGRRVALRGGGAEIKAIAWAAQRLMSGRPTDHPELCVYRNWDEVKRAANEEGSQLRMFVGMVERYGPSALVSAMNVLMDEKRGNPSLVVATAHKAKGWESPKVRVCGDFAQSTDEEKEPELPEAEDIMLAYVTVTRAVEVLDRGPLDYIDRL